MRHTQVLRPSPGSLNPYHVGMKIWEDIEKRWKNPSAAEEMKNSARARKTPMEKLFEVREVERDSSFLRRYLTEELMRELNLFEYKTRGNEQVVSRVADKDNWRQIKDTLIQTSAPAPSRSSRSKIRITRTTARSCSNMTTTAAISSWNTPRRLCRYVQQLWGHDVAMETVVETIPNPSFLRRRQAINPQIRLASITSEKFVRRKGASRSDEFLLEKDASSLQTHSSNSRLRSSLFLWGDSETVLVKHIFVPGSDY